MVPEGSLPCSQQPTTGPYFFEPDESSPHLPIYAKVFLVPFPSGFRNKILYV